MTSHKKTARIEFYTHGKIVKKRENGNVSKIKTEILKTHEARLTIKIEEERLKRATDTAVKRISKRIRTPGFRPGKAPLHVIASQIGMEAIQEQTLEILGVEVYSEALKESGASPYAPGQLTDVSYDPMVMTFIVPLQPEIDLGNYRALRVQFESTEITDEIIESAIENLREEHAILEPVERPAEKEDALAIKIIGRVDGEDNPILEDDKLQVVVGGQIEEGLPGITNHLIGLTVGEVRSFELRIPRKKKFGEEVRGKKLRIELTCLEVYDRELPALDDEFAYTVGDYESVEVMRAKIHEAMERAVKNKDRREYADRVIGEFIERAKVQFPPAMVEEEIDDMMESLDKDLQEQRQTLKDYLQINNLSEEDLRDNFRPMAEERLRTGLALSELVRLESLTVDAEEIEDEIKTRSLSFGSAAQSAQRTLGGKEGKKTIHARLLTEKAIDHLIAIAKGKEVPPPKPLANAE